MTLLVFCGGVFAGLLVASWIASREVDAAHRRADELAQVNDVLLAENRRMERLCARAYQHMGGLNPNATIVARLRDRGATVTHRDGSPLVGLDAMGDLWPEDVR